MMRMDTLLDRNDDACTPMHVDTSTYGPLICLWIVVMFIDFFHRSQKPQSMHEVQCREENFLLAYVLTPGLCFDSRM